ncbi:biotin/lipoyl-binding protein, partial [Acinetobacter baumannii]
SSKLAGYVRAVAVADDQQVAAGAVLVEIDPTDYRTRVSAADAEIATAQAGARTNRAEQAEAAAARDQARAASRSAQAGLDFAERELA